MSIWLVTDACRSETATAVMVMAADGQHAKERAIALEDPFYRPYIQFDQMKAELARDGLVAHIDAPH